MYLMKVLHIPTRYFLVSSDIKEKCIMTLEQLITSVDWERIDPPNWSRETPKLLRILISEGETQIGIDARERLRNFIAHQSGVYELTINIVPILISVLDSDRIKNKGWALNLLQSAQSQQVIHYQNQERLELAHNLYNIMYNNIEIFKDYLNHQDTKYRMFSTIILSRFVLHAKEILDLLLLRCQVESNSEVILTLLDRLSILIRQSNPINKQSIAICFAKMIHSENAYIKCRAAIAILETNPQEFDALTQDMLTDSFAAIALNKSSEFNLDQSLAAKICVALKYMDRERAKNLLTNLIEVSLSSNMEFIFVRELEILSKA